MPPADNTNTPAPTPTPEEPKKPGFFARLFGKKQEDTPAVPPRESLTPKPELDDNPPRDATASADPSAPMVGMDVTSPNGNPAGSELSQPVPTLGANEEPQTLDVPSNVSAPEVDSPDGTVAPTLPTDPSASDAQSDDPSAPKPM